MNKRVTLGLAVAVVVVLVGGFVWNANRSTGIHEGDAFEDGGGSTAELTTVAKGEDVWLLAASVTNQSGSQLTFDKAGPGTTSPGLEYIDAKVFKRDDFTAGVPFAWDTGSGDAADPGRIASRPVQGYRLLPGEGLTEDVILLHFRVTTDTKPLESNGVVFEYSQRGRQYKQTVGTNLQVLAAKS